eukprot:336007-Hanusia_phi.AAC.1
MVIPCMSQTRFQSSGHRVPSPGRAGRRHAGHCDRLGHCGHVLSNQGQDRTSPGPPGPGGSNDSGGPGHAMIK